MRDGKQNTGKDHQDQDAEERRQHAYSQDPAVEQVGTVGKRQ